ncbi:GtrA family protein [Crocosphaera sp. XPORK-15E]|nr:GtrA family protein [Crocosphaera sp. XPORK-15E]MEA5536953.1 GtrA family protein [Crocosphaera sp. XPORK-15E]
MTREQYLEYIQHLLTLSFSFWPVKRFLTFGLVGFSGIFVDMAVLYLLHDPTTLNWGLTRSKIIAVGVAIINNFFWNDAWTFGDISDREKGCRKKIKRFFKFYLICLTGGILNVLLLNIFYNLFDVKMIPKSEYIANLMAIAIVTIWNFSLNLKFNWCVTEDE